MAEYELPPPPSKTELVKDNRNADSIWKNWLYIFYEQFLKYMNYDFFLKVSRGLVAGHTTEHKFGANLSVGTTLVPVCYGGIYRTPTSTVTLEAISDDANDTAAGTGAREITLVYLDSNCDVQTGTMAMNGLTATTDTVTGVFRLIRLYVSSSGTYADPNTPAFSQNGTITVRVSGAGATWAQIPEIGTTGNAVGQSLIGCYTVPNGKTLYMLEPIITVDSGKTVDLYFFKRENVDDMTTPYSPLRLQNFYSGLQGGPYPIPHKTNESYAAKTDLIWMATVTSGTAEVSVEFEFLLIDN